MKEGKIMTQRIVSIMGSPHSKGNLAISLDCLLTAEKNKGTNCLTYELAKMQIRPCLGCRKCIENGGNCVLNDDAKLIMEEIKSADVVILATPIYINQMSGPMKNFLDRMYPLTNEKHQPRFGKHKLIMLYTYGVPIPLMFSRYIRTTGKSLKAMGLIYSKRIAVHGCVTLDKVQNDTKLQNKLKEIGKKILSE